MVYHAMIGMATTLEQINGCMDTKEHVLKGEFIKLQELWNYIFAKQTSEALKLSKFELHVMEQNARDL